MKGLSRGWRLATAGLVAVLLAALFGIIYWEQVVTACGPLMGYLLDNLIPLLDFAVVLFVVISLQIVRAELATRTSRFERLESELAAIKSAQFQEIEAVKAAIQHANIESLTTDHASIRSAQVDHLEAEAAQIKKLNDD